MITLNEYLDDLPLLHSWDGGKTWNTGGFDRETLQSLHPHMTEGAEILETGAGNSTIFFLFHKPKRLVSVAPDQGLFDRIHAYCDEHGIDRGRLQTEVECSEWVLPLMAKHERFDFILIDGCHGWPLVFVDFCYANAMLREGGILAIDDTQIHSVKELGRLLMQQPEFELLAQIEKTALFRKSADVRMLPGWFGQPYIRRQSENHSQSADPYSIQEPVPLAAPPAPPPTPPRPRWAELRQMFRA